VRHRCPFRLKSAVRQTRLRRPHDVDRFKQLMRAGQWDFERRADSLVFWRCEQTIYISEGHHRVNAALELGEETGDWSYLDRLISHGKLEAGLPPSSDVGRFPTRRWWSRLLGMLGL
jgi:hypothetical protein